MNTAHDTRASAWAPWWAYVAPIAVINLPRQLVVPPSEVGDAVAIALVAATVTLVVLLVTAVHRGLRSPPTRWPRRAAAGPRARCTGARRGRR